MVHRVTAGLVHSNHAETEHLLYYTACHECLLNWWCNLVTEENDHRYKEKIVTSISTLITGIFHVSESDDSTEWKPIKSQRADVWQETGICVSGKGDEGIHSNKCRWIPTDKNCRWNVLVKTLLGALSFLSQTIVSVSLMDNPRQMWTTYKWKGEF